MAIMIAFAPPVQWWFANTGLVEMLIYMQLSVLMLQKYMTDSRFAFRLLYLFVIVICAGGYVLTFYPSWMIPFAYILLALALWVFIENLKNCKMRISDWLSIGVSVLIFAVSMIYFYHMSKETIRSLMATVYPGSRFETGGGMLNLLFLYITNIWHAVLGDGALVNVCESSYFIDFFPVCWILPVLALLRSQKKDMLLQFLLFVSAILGIYCVFGFPKTLSKISLLSNCQATRVLVALGFCNVLLLIRTLSQPCSVCSSSVLKSVAGSFVTVFIAVQACKTLNTGFLYKNKVILFGTILTFFVLYFCLLSFKSKRRFVWISGTIAVTLFSSLLANPVRHGIKSVENISVLKTWRETHLQKPDAKWLIENCDYPITNSGLLIGIPAINSTNVYPNLDRWHLIDPERKYETVYNRYAHISMKLEEVPAASFDLLNPDWFSCTLSISDAKKLGVSFVMSNRKLFSYIYSGDMTLLAEANGFYFYKINEVAVPMEILGDELPSFEPTETSFPYFIDSENISSRAISLAGWAYHENDDCDVYIGIEDKTFKAQKVHRPDVKEAFCLENDTQGFSATIPLESDLQSYTLYLVNNSKKEIYRKTISISKSDDLDELFSNAVDVE
ncbi:hypothetical protein TRSA_12350 [Treponema saccharophilum]|uniref:Uncharacterized protein n=2 Tax=Treponema saccharophilum TaxID=165 RepID=H7EI31_9SPIR|nr:hypothetical protein TresaDRAFT_2205 [Treponema saccharophilum DSM 2985]BDC96136.1 hypothetical protein TRSA_12350 [Treponema saccharophilum]